MLKILCIGTPTRITVIIPIHHTMHQIKRKSYTKLTIIALKTNKNYYNYRE